MRPRRHLYVLCASLGLFCAAPPAAAAIYTLRDLNSVLTISDSDQRGAYSWTIDGVEVLYQQWFWYRVGNQPEQSLDKLPLLGAATFGGLTCATCGLDLLYQGNGFTVQITYSLRGGEPGTGTADLGEQIRINNYCNTSLDLHFYQYSDFKQLAAAPDTVDVDPTYYAVTQAPLDKGLLKVETSVAQRPRHVEAGLETATLNRLNDGQPTLLNDALTAGAGNGTWAFQWDKVIARRGSYLISTDTVVSAVPEPASLLLVLSASIIVARHRRRLKRGR
jgi:hypothetical protein